MKAVLQEKTQARLIAADFLADTLRAFLIGLGVAITLSGAVILLAQSSAPHEAAPGNKSVALKEAP